MMCRHDRKGKQCGSPSRFDIFTLDTQPKWITRSCREHLASTVWDAKDPAVMVVRRPMPPTIDVPDGVTPTKRLRRTLRRRAARSAP